MRWIAKGLFVLWFLCAATFGKAPVVVEFFYDLGCHDCEQIEQNILPQLEETFGDACLVQSYDIGTEAGFLHLLELEDALGYTEPGRAYLIVDEQVIFGPEPGFERLCAAISSRMDLEETAPADSSSHVKSPADPEPLLEEWFSGFTFSAVLVAGFLDGLNPCAISTLVFFMSLLAVTQVRSRQLILLGISYVTASFLTYLALGFGLFRILHLFSGFVVLRSVVEWGMFAILLVLAGLSFRDAIRFRKSQDGRAVTLQLSTGMKKRIHGVMRRGLSRGHILWGGFFIGTLVTALESVCTGQVYVPTLVLILKNNALAGSRAWFYLVTYNLLFILPLVVTFIAVYFGLRTQTLLHWSKQNVVLSKTLLGVFFSLMALFLLMM